MRSIVKRNVIMRRIPVYGVETQKTSVVNDRQHESIKTNIWELGRTHQNLVSVPVHSDRLC